MDKKQAQTIAIGAVVLVGVGVALYMLRPATPPTRAPTVTPNPGTGGTTPPPTSGGTTPTPPTPPTPPAPPVAPVSALERLPLDQHISEAIATFCKRTTLSLIPLVGGIDAFVCANEAREYVTTGARADYYGKDPGLLSAHKRYMAAAK